MSNGKRISIIGDGAMGVLYASMLSSFSPVTVFSRNAERTEKRNVNGIRVISREGAIICRPVFSSDKSAISSSDLVILFVKSTATAGAIEEYKEYIPEGAYIMTLQNGAGHLEELRRYFPEERIIIGVTEHNASVIDDCTINHGGCGKTVISTSPEWVKDAFSSAGIETEVSDCVMRDIWRKLLTNASLSTATALLMCSIDSLGRSSGAFSIVEKLLEEAVMVAAGDGYRFSYDEVRRELYEKTRTSHNAYTSIYSDLKNGRKTEVDYISGYVTARAEALGLDVPYQRAAVDMIHAKEEISSIGC